MVNFIFYAHLQPNSIKIELGDEIVKVQAIAILGNSGDSLDPHSHFSVNESTLQLQMVLKMPESMLLLFADTPVEPAFQPQ